MATQHKEFIEAMDNIEKALKAPTAQGLKGADLCATYHKIKPWLNRVLPILEKIPVVGKVADAIRLLMLLADQVCPA